MMEHEEVELAPDLAVVAFARFLEPSDVLIEVCLVNHAVP